MPKRSKKPVIEFPVTNVYGQPYVYYDERENKYYIVLQDYYEVNKSEISKSFYNSCKREFKKPDVEG